MASLKHICWKRRVGGREREMERGRVGKERGGGREGEGWGERERESSQSSVKLMFCSTHSLSVKVGEPLHWMSRKCLPTLAEEVHVRSVRLRELQQ